MSPKEGIDFTANTRLKFMYFTANTRLEIREAVILL